MYLYRMREIKFKAWDELKLIMHNNFQFIRSGIEGNDWIVFSSDKQEIDFNNPNPYFSQQLKIMQFTGLQDKNGKDIYEGDIMICHEYDSSDCGKRIVQTFNNAVVGFSNGSYYYFPKGNMRMPHQLLMHAYKPLIIGNIYENPELLTP
jgi:uncharacterized phage protein (TIGR01671 family)